MSAAAGGLLAVNARDPEEVRVARIAEGRIQDLRWARADRATQVGNLYLAEVRQVEPGLDAAFVDYGGGRSGFLHLGNVHPGYADREADPFTIASSPAAAAAVLAGEEPGTEEPPPSGIASLLQPGRRLLVQVLRDPVRGKGATLTTFVSLAGRLLVLMPSLGRVGVSRRIGDEAERRRLRDSVAASGAPQGLGVIARTAAAGARRRDLQRDLDHLLETWRRVGEEVAKASTPGPVWTELAPEVRAVRDLGAGPDDRILVDSAAAAERIGSFLSAYLPEGCPRIEVHDRRRPLFESLDIERDYQLLFRPRVPVGNGASIVIHETEALTAIDVNSGRIDKGSLELTALEANKLAAAEIARQIRLRDLGGILVVDFIDMTEAAHRREVESWFRGCLKADRARYKAGRLGAFGLMALTRRRLGTGLPRASETPCPDCGGSGTRIQHRAGALRALRRLRALEAGRPWRLRAHPGVVAELRAHHGAALAGLPVALSLEADPALPPGDPVLK
ncbi:MAG: Rne/Rng family ribonuclease [Planctomycetota bacterium]|nr:MAG: Rne/Rng family ribonuclease [Planctomycetota bacterium]